MLQSTTNAVLWDENQSAMEIEVSLLPVTAADNNLQAPVSPFSLGSLELSPSPSPANQEGSVSTGTTILESSQNKNSPINTNTNTHLPELTELAADLAWALSYTEGYGPDRGKQTRQEKCDVYELQTLTRRPSIRAAGFDVVDSSCSSPPIGRKVRAERRIRRYVLV